MADGISGLTRRDFVKATGTAALGAMAAPAAAQTPRPTGAPLRYAVVGTGVRGLGMWGRSIVQNYKGEVEFVGLCDINPKRLAYAKTAMGVPASTPTFGSLDEMLDKARPDLLMVTTVDATHTECIVKGLERGIRVATEKPMVVDEVQCQRVLDTEKRTGKEIIVTFNYRYAPKHQKIKELLMAGEIGTVTSVDFNWFLDTSHGADYFRRWHRLRSRGGSLWVHKATHHFDLINWWLDADPVEVSATGRLAKYGKNGPFRSTNCRPCPHKGQCEFHWNMTTNADLVGLYANAESEDGYLRDGCVFKEDVDIFDTMNAVVKYSNGANMSYSLNAFMPVEGYHLAFNGTKGRLEVRDYERQPWKPERTTDIYLIKNFGARTLVEVPSITAGHGGGDDVLRDLVFRNLQVPAHMRLPSSRAGAMSCLTGIAARKSCDSGQPVKVADLVRF